MNVDEKLRSVDIFVEGWTYASIIDTIQREISSCENAGDFFSWKRMIELNRVKEEIIHAMIRNAVEEVIAADEMETREV